MPRCYSEQEVQEMLKAAAGWKGAGRYADKIGVSRAHLSEVMNGKKSASEIMLRSLGLRTAIIRQPRKRACTSNPEGS